MRNEKMKIAFFVQRFPAVSEIWIVNQIVALLNEGHHVDIFAQSKSDDTIIHQKVMDYDLLNKTTFLDSLPHKRWDKLKLYFKQIFKHFNKRTVLFFCHSFFYFFRYKKSNVSIYSALNFIDKPSYDIAHAHYGFVGNYMVLLKYLGILRNTQIVTSFHGFDFIVENGYYNFLFQHGNSFIVNSNYSKSELLALGCSNEKITKLPVGLQTDYFKKNSQSFLNKSDSFTLIYVARLVEFKSPNTFIEICKKLVENNIEFKAKIIGDGELRRSVESQIKKYQLDENVILYGKQTQEEIISHLLNADVFVLTGIVDSNGVTETQGLVIQEAQSMELPVVVSDSGGMKEGVIENETGFVIRDNDVEQFVEKIIFLKNNPAIREKMGKKGREFVQDNYDVVKLNIKLIELYSNLIENR